MLKPCFVVCTLVISPAIIGASFFQERDLSSTWHPGEDVGFLSNERQSRRPWHLEDAETKTKWVQVAEAPTNGSFRPVREAIGSLPLMEAQSYIVPPQDPDQNCSINSNPVPTTGEPNTEHHCSVQGQPTRPFTVGGDGGVQSQTCSTRHADPNFLLAVCSAIFNGPSGGYPGGNNYCSTGVRTDEMTGIVSACSTSGGTTGVGGLNPNGHPSCSAGSVLAIPPGNVRYCSTAGNLVPPVEGTTVTCSTGGGIAGAPGNGGGTGEHQSCSAGMIANWGDYAFCSADPGMTEGSNFCSVNQPATEDASRPVHGNKCSAMNMPPGPNPQNGTRQCSVFTRGGTDMSTDFCSVTRAVADAENGACTVMTMSINAPNPQNAYCSAMGGTPPPMIDDVPQGGCSIRENGTVTGPDPATGLCGTMTGHHPGPIPAPPSGTGTGPCVSNEARAGSRRRSHAAAMCPLCDEGAYSSVAAPCPFVGRTVVGSTAPRSAVLVDRHRFFSSERARQ